MTGIAGCCARAAQGHAVAPPSVAKNFHRSMWLAMVTLRLGVIHAMERLYHASTRSVIKADRQVVLPESAWGPTRSFDSVGSMSASASELELNSVIPIELRKQPLRLLLRQPASDHQCGGPNNAEFCSRKQTARWTNFSSGWASEQRRKALDRKGLSPTAIAKN
jgi:hypothetical protein